MQRNSNICFLCFILWLPMTLTMFGKKDSLYTAFSSRLYPGIYAIGSIETTNHLGIDDYQLKPSKVAEYEIKHGINTEIKLSDRRAIRIGLLFSELWYPFLWYPENYSPYGAYPPPPPDYGNSYYLKTIQYRFEFPLEFKYTLIKSSRKSKIKPYFLAGFSPTFMYRKKLIYKNNGGTTVDHEEIDRTFVNYSSRLILTLGVNYSITKKINLYFEPHYINYRKFGLAIGASMHF